MGGKHETMTPPIEAQTLRGTSKTSNARDHKGVKVALSELFLYKFSVADLEYTLNHLSKWLMMILHGTILICRHDSEALWIAWGSLVNATLSFVLKKMFNQDRPVSTLRSDPGMPSTHAQTFFFTVVFAIIYLFQCHGVNAFTIALSGLTLAFGSYLSWLRVTQEFHTISQVVVGAVLGTIVSILWVWSWEAGVHKEFNSSFWVQVIVDLGAVSSWIGFLIAWTRNLAFTDRRSQHVKTKLPIGADIGRGDA